MEEKVTPTIASFSTGLGALFITATLETLLVEVLQKLT